MTPSARPRRGLRAIAASVYLALAPLAGCATRKPPVLEPLRVRDTRVPVVIIPGITGVELVDRDSGEVQWGDGPSLLFPRDGGARLAIGRDGGSALVPGRPVWRIRLLGIPLRPVYGGVRETFLANGYREGDLAAPHPGEDLYFLSYDWRRSSVDAAVALLERLDAVRRARGSETLAVRVVAQSNGAHIVRWLAKYGGGTLEEAEAGVARSPDWLRIEDVVLVGSANLGAIRTLREMDRGRRYIAVVGRHLQGEVFSTFPGLYEALPAPGTARFVDPAGHPLQVDLHDPQSWVAWDWSGFADRDGADLAWLAERLDRAARVHRALLADPPGFRPPRIHTVGSFHSSTAVAAVLESRSGRPKTLFPGDRKVDRNAVLAAATTAPGDGHASVASQSGLSPGERAAISPDPIWLDGKHFDMILDPLALRQVLELFERAESSKRTR